jgi:hypothetical protein
MELMKFENTSVMNFEGAIRGMRNPMNSWDKSDSIFDIYCEHEDCGYEFVDEVAHRWAKYLLKGATFATEEEYDKEFERIVEGRREWLWREGASFIGIDHHYTLALIGPNDMDLCRRLINGGSEHRKFLRQIMVSVDITAPLYWWKEFDTYKVGTTANSTSTMHKLASTPITRECFEMDDFAELQIEGIYNEEDELMFDYTTGDFLDDIIDTLEELRQKYLETKDKRYWKELIRWLPNGWLQTRTVTMNYENLRSMAHQRAGHKLSEWRAFCEWAQDLPYSKELIFD